MKKLILIVLLIVQSVQAQQKNCFTNSEVDSIYSKLTDRLLLIDKVTEKTNTISYLDSLVKSHEHGHVDLVKKISLLENKEIHFLELIDSKDKYIKQNKKVSRRKRFYTFLKGFAVGFLVALIIK